jgi:hypothetical protein
MFEGVPPGLFEDQGESADAWSFSENRYTEKEEGRVREHTEHDIHKHLPNRWLFALG